MTRLAPLSALLFLVAVAGCEPGSAARPRRAQAFTDGGAPLAEPVAPAPVDMPTTEPGENPEADSQSDVVETLELPPIPDLVEGATAQTGLTVDQAVAQRGCSTTAVRGLSEQLIAEVQCLRPGSMKSISGISNVSLGSAVFPYLQTPAADALRRAAARRSGSTLFLNSALRTLAQQYLLYAWQGSCGITIAAAPGRSNHNGGVAVDVSDYASWRSALQAENFQWLGASDEVHFDYVGGGTVDFRSLSVLAFQRLWNRNHPEDRIAEDSSYGPTTESRLRRSPAAGFATGASCGAPTPTPTPTTPTPAIAAMAVSWTRQASGAYEFRATAPASVARVEYYVDAFRIGSATRGTGTFGYTYSFSSQTNARVLEARGLDAAGAVVARGNGVLDVTAGTAIFVRQTAASTYEIGFERAPAGVASLEVRADTYLLTDADTGRTRSTRLAVRAAFSTLGVRNLELRTYDAAGALRGTLRRTVTLRGTLRRTVTLR